MKGVKIVPKKGRGRPAKTFTKQRTIGLQVRKEYTRENIETFKKKHLKQILLRNLIKLDLDFKNIVAQEYVIEEEYCKKFQDIPDSVADADVDIFKCYFENEAFKIFQNKVIEKKKLLETEKILYKCGKCGVELSNSVSSVACDLCGTWYHISKGCSVGYDVKKDAKAKKAAAEAKKATKTKKDANVKKNDYEYFWLCSTCTSFTV